MTSVTEEELTRLKEMFRVRGLVKACEIDSKGLLANGTGDCSVREVISLISKVLDLKSTGAPHRFWEKDNKKIAGILMTGTSFTLAIM